MLKGFEYEKAKTVLRAVNGGASDEVIESQILPAENLETPLGLTSFEAPKAFRRLSRRCQEHSGARH